MMSKDTMRARTSNQEELIKTTLIETTIIENKRLEEAINELKHEGCALVSIKAQIYLDNPQYIGFNDFKLKALETKLVIMSPSDSGIILVVQNEGTQWIWIPP